MRPGLGTIIKIYLRLIDEIEYDELVKALEKIATVFQEEIAPYAAELCSRLGESYVRMCQIARERNLELCDQ